MPSTSSKMNETKDNLTAEEIEGYCCLCENHATLTKRWGKYWTCNKCWEAWLENSLAWNRFTHRR